MYCESGCRKTFRNGSKVSASAVRQSLHTYYFISSLLAGCMQHKNPDKVFFWSETEGGSTAPGKSFPATSGKEELYNKLLFYIPKYLFSSTTTTNQNYSFVREKLHPAPPRKLLFLQKHPCVISWLPCKKAGKSCFDGNKRPATNA